MYYFYSKWSSSVNSINCAKIEPLFLSTSNFSSYSLFSLPLTMYPASCMENLFSHGHMLYSYLVPSPYESLPFLTVLYLVMKSSHVTIFFTSQYQFHICLIWLSFYSTILRALWCQSWGWVFCALISLVLENCRMIEGMSKRMNK